MSKGNLKLAYWGAGGFVDLDSAYNKTTKAWAYNTISISFARLILEKGGTQSSQTGDFKYFLEEWENGPGGDTYSVGIGIPNINLKGTKAISNQNSVAQAKIIDSTLKRIQKGDLQKPENLLLSLRDPLFSGLDGLVGGDGAVPRNNVITVARDPACIPSFIKAFQTLNSYYGNIFNGIDYDIEEYTLSSNPHLYDLSDVKAFADNFTESFKQSNSGFIVTAAPMCHYKDTPYYHVKGIDHMIPQCYPNYKEGEGCPPPGTDGPPPPKGLCGFKSWTTETTTSNNYKAINHCVKDNGGTSMWDLEWDVLGNQTDATTKAIRECCKLTHGDTLGNLGECDSISSIYPRYTYSNEIQKDILPHFSVGLTDTDIVYPQICKQSPAPAPAPSSGPIIKGISIQGGKLIINYNSGSPAPAPGPGPAPAPGPAKKIIPRNDKGTPVNGIFYNMDNIPQLRASSSLVPPQTNVSSYKCGTQPCKSDFIIAAFTLPQPWLKGPPFDKVHVKLNGKEGINGGLTFGGSTALLSEWSTFFKGIDTLNKAKEFIVSYGFDTKDPDHHLYEGWTSIFIDMESKGGDPNSLNKTEGIDIKGSISNLYKGMKDITTPLKLYLVVNPSDYEHYLGKWDVDGIISMNYGGDEPTNPAYYNTFKDLAEKSVNYIIPGINPQNDDAALIDNPSLGRTPAGSVSTYLDMGYNIGHGVFVWASSWGLCDYCKGDMLVKYIDNFNTNNKGPGGDICVLSNKGPDKICFTGGWNPDKGCSTCTNDNSCSGSSSLCNNVRNEYKECIPCSTNGNCGSTTGDSSCSTYQTNASCAAFSCTWTKGCTGPGKEHCPSVLPGAICKDNKETCCENDLCYCNTDKCP